MALTDKLVKPNLLFWPWEYLCQDSCIEILNINLFTDDDLINASGMFFVKFFTAEKVVAQITNDPIILSRSIE